MPRGRRVLHELGSGGGWGRLPSAADAKLRTVRPLRAHEGALLPGQARLVLAGGAGSPCAAAAVAALRGDRDREEAADRHLHAALLPQVRSHARVQQRNTHDINFLLFIVSRR